MKNLAIIITLILGWAACGNSNSRVTDESLPEKIIYYQIGDTRIPIHLQQFSEKPEYIFINLHDNEFTSVSAALPVIKEQGGLLIRIDNERERVIRFRHHGRRYSFDPNRMFSDTGIRETLKENSDADSNAVNEVRKFAERILSLIPETPGYVFALHNNTDGGFSVLSYQKGGEYYNDAKKTYRNPKEDPDDFVFTTDEKVYEKASARGYNAILQDNSRATQDGSLSVYAGERGWKYINIETEHGKVGKYRAMLSGLIEKLSD